MKKIVWCITGSGSGIRRVTEIFTKVKKEFDVKITLAFSRWGYIVSRMYGLHDDLKRIASGGYYEEWLIGDQGFYYSGRLNMGRYDLVVVAPATSNTVSKIVYGVADTLPTLIVSEALKSEVPVIIYPSDVPGPDGYSYSEAPCYVDTSMCRCIVEQGYCPAMSVCPVNAFTRYEDFVRIDLSKCIGCEKCVDACIHGAIKCWEIVRVKPKRIDLENIEKLRKMENVFVANDPESLYELIKDRIG